MIKRRLLGQHFLNSDSVAELVVSSANITKRDTVFEIGTGLGILTPLLCQKAGKVISVDADKELVEKAKAKFSDIDNLVLESGDGFKMRDAFSVFVSNLPYSKSRDAVEWLAQTAFSHGVIMVQKEFADKLLAEHISKKKRRAVSVVATFAFDITVVSKVSRNNFSPPPKVDSVILKIVKKNDMTREVVQTVNKVFSYRRKTIKNILKQFGQETMIDKRVEELTGEEIVEIAVQILRR